MSTSATTGSSLRMPMSTVSPAAVPHGPARLDRAMSARPRPIQGAAGAHPRVVSFMPSRGASCQGRTGRPRQGKVFLSSSSAGKLATVPREGTTWSPREVTLTSARSGEKAETMMTSALLKAETVTIVGNTSVDIPLHEEPIPLAEYLGDVNRIFYNIFPDKSRSEKLNDTLWRIKLEQHDFLFFRVTPVVDLRVWVEWEDGNPDPILRLAAARCDLGPSLGGLMRAAQFELDVNGRLFPDRKPVASSARTHMYGEVDIKVRLLKIAAFGFIPAKGVEKAGTAVCNAILNALQQTVSHTLLASYKEFCAAELRGPKAAEPREPIVPGDLSQPKAAELVIANTVD